jgi:hypothetical protein
MEILHMIIRIQPIYRLIAAAVVGGCVAGSALGTAISEKPSTKLSAAELAQLVGASCNNQCPTVVDPAGCA